MEGGATAAEAAFTEAQTACGATGALHEAFVCALASAAALPEVCSTATRPLRCCCCCSLACFESRYACLLLVVLLLLLLVPSSSL